MPENSQASSYEERLERAKRLRPWYAARLVGSSLRQLEGLSGINRSLLFEFISKKQTPQEENLQRLEEWAIAEGWDSAQQEPRRVVEPDEEFWIRYDAIEARNDLTNAEKERRIENLSSALRAMAYRWDARASDSRNRAMREEAVGRSRRDIPPSDPTQVRTFKDLDPLPRSTKRVRRRGGEKE